ncbi:hypothetical protein V6N12_056630 [Hibiscus sabdariffa]|uniref:RNase H type-1 domain-containing protein n=1 Tax=Hibiscus sabdariffa TaxID=183260 RepID=A0ABR2CT31_9ROSI
MQLEFSYPESGWICLNLDGAVHSSSSLRSAGGILRNHKGEFILAYHRKLGHTTVLHAEFWGVFEGLQLAWAHGYEYLAVQIDSSDALQLLSPSSPESPIPFVRSIADIFNRAWFVEFFLVPREANFVTDYMAKFVPHQDSLLTIFEAPPASLAEILHRNICGPPFSQLIHEVKNAPFTNASPSEIQSQVFHTSGGDISLLVTSSVALCDDAEYRLPWLIIVGWLLPPIAY